MVLGVATAGILEAGVVHRGYDLEQDRQHLGLLYRNAVAIVGPVNDLDLVVRPEFLQRVGHPSLDLEVVGHGIVLHDAEEAVCRERPHQTTSMAKPLSPAAWEVTCSGSCSSGAS